MAHRSNLLLFPLASSPLLPAFWFRPSLLCWQAHRHGDDEICPGHVAVPVLRVSPWGLDTGPPPTDQQPVTAACGARNGADLHEVPAQAQREQANTLRLSTSWFSLFAWTRVYSILDMESGMCQWNGYRSFQWFVLFNLLTDAFKTIYKVSVYLYM